MRLTGGALRGRVLAAPRSGATRPTSDRVREAIFNILTHGTLGVELAGARIIDLFAGTGALGFEALSRGAAFCLFVEEDAEARGVLRRNIETLGLEGVTRVFRRDATALGDAGRQGTFTLAFLDPPYGQGLGEKALASLAAGGWLAPGAAVVLEADADALVGPGEEFTVVDRRTWGRTQAVFAVFAAEPGRGAVPGR